MTRFYKIGTVTTVQNSASVTGNLTAWVTGGVLGGALMLNGKVYAIETIVSNTELTLARPFPDAGQTNAEYEIDQSSAALLLLTGNSQKVSELLDKLRDEELHSARDDNPHNVTKAQVGLGDVDNTSDTGKPVSTAQQAALDQKLSLSGGTVKTQAGADIDAGTSGAIACLLIEQDTVDADALIGFHVAGDFATYFGLDGGLNDFVIGGWSLGSSTKYRIWSEYNNELVGQVAFFALSSAPNGWIKANGAAISRTAYADLFAKIGTSFGVGDGSTTFNLPDLRGEFIRSLDDGRGVDSGRSLGSWQNEEIQSHQHSLRGPAGHSHGTQFGGGTVSATFAYAPDAINANAAYQGIWYADNTGGSETRPRNIALLACIKY